MGFVEREGRDVRLHPVGPLRGSVRLPGSKSLTNRYLACTALADGRSLLRGRLPGGRSLRLLAHQNTRGENQRKAAQRHRQPLLPQL